jgi:isopenicillin-N epimerase
MKNSGMPGWSLDPTIDFLNHGSFGACPVDVLAQQDALRRRLEAEPVRFMMRELEPLLDDARARVAAFVGAAPADLVFVHNATSAVNGVLRSLRLAPGDEILTTDHAYNACKNALDWVAERAGARVVVAPVPFPLRDATEITAAITARASARTRLALVDHVTSQTGLIFPVAEIVRALAGIDVLVDGAHAPGMVPLELGALGAAYYTGNCHKWLCAPKGAAFLAVRADRQEHLVPAVISHGLNADATARGRSRYHLLFDWIGSDDPTAWLCVPAAIDWMAARLPGGWPAVRQRNHELAVAARRLLLDGRDLPCPDEMIGSIASIPIPDGDADALGRRLLDEHGIEVPVFPWPSPPRRLLRISAQLYNTMDQYERLLSVFG